MSGREVVNRPTIYSYFLRFIFFIYRPFLEISLSIYLGNKVKVLLRNSARLNYARFPFSDIDLTVLIDDKKSVPQDKIKNAFSFVQIVLPLCREANIYLKSNIYVLAPFFNFYELSRDPMLMDLAQISPQESSSPLRFQKFSFLLRMFLADYRNLQFKPHVRKPKWRHHFISVEGNVDLTKISYDFILDQIIQVLELDENDNLKIKKAINKFIEYRESARPMHHLSETFAEYPAIPIIFYSQYAYGDFLPENLETWQVDLIKESIRWEIVGCSSQIFLMPEIIREHMENLKRGAERLLSRQNFAVDLQSSLKIIDKILNS